MSKDCLSIINDITHPKSMSPSQWIARTYDVNCLLAYIYSQGTLMHLGKCCSGLANHNLEQSW
jgi:hypothetical protein